MTVGVTEVKRDDLPKGVAQNMVQIESILPNRKRKADSMGHVRTEDMDNQLITRFGIITDAEVWRFLECNCGHDDKPEFKLSREYKVLYGETIMEAKLKEILDGGAEV